MIRSSAVWSGGTKAVTSMLLLVVISGCLLSISTLNKDHATVSEIERSAQNASASSLYIRLATISQPATTSDVTYTLLEFIRKDDLIDGATLLNADDQLVAQLGTGNDALLRHPTTSQTARIPIRSTDSTLYGHAIVAFKPSQDALTVAIRYIALTTMLALLALATIMLLHIHWQMSSAIVISWRGRRSDPA